jgi:hypothetical protein
MMMTTCLMRLDALAASGPYETVPGSTRAGDKEGEPLLQALDAISEHAINE